MRRLYFPGEWKRHAVVLFSSFLFFLTLVSGTGPAFGSPEEELLLSTQGQNLTHPMKRPLSPKDPRAQVDPALLKAPPIPAPKSQEFSGIEFDHLPVREVIYDVATRSQRTRPQTAGFPIAPESADKPLITYGNPGASLSLEYPGGIQQESVLGSDDRVRIKATTKYPWRTMCKLFMTFPNGLVYMGSGSLIGNKYVLTAGHCVYSIADGGWATKIEVIPGMSGKYKPYGSAFAAKMRSYEGWTRDEDWRYDMALITLNKKIGVTTGWQGFAYYPDLSGIMGKVCGYPGDRNGGIYPFYDDGPIKNYDKYRVRYIIDTAGGQSGSGVYLLKKGSPVIFTVHTNGEYMGANSGTRIDQAKFKALKSWISSNQ